MKRHQALLAIATLTVAALLEACINDHKPNISTPGTPKTTSPSPSPPSKPPTYTMPANLCTAVSADAFADLAPAAPPKTSEKARSQTSQHTSSTCTVTLGTLDQAALVSVGVDLFTDPLGAQSQYEKFRASMFKDYPEAHDVTGVGTAAYSFTEPAGGPHLVVHFGNAHMGVSVVHLDSGKTLPSNVENRLIATAKATLAKLPTT